MRGLMWFREDLRVMDNTALTYALNHCSDGIFAIYLIDKSSWKKHNIAACKIEFILRGLKILQADLMKLNIPLLVLEITNTNNIANEIFTLMQQFQVKRLVFNKQYEFNENKRDQAIHKFLAEKDLLVTSFDDQVILAPGTVQTKQNQPFSIFTPYKRAWQKVFAESNIKILPKLKAQIPLSFTVPTAPPPENIAGIQSAIDPKLWPAGEHAAQKRLNYFLQSSLFNYDTQRNFPAIDGTSMLSPYLSVGMISAKQCFLSALLENNSELTSGNTGAITWLGELIWREFYKHLLVAAPWVSMAKPYKKAAANIPWEFNESLWLAWQQGNTGYPLIDAAMRQLKHMGWMHNRLRMVVAMFLTKNLFFNWQHGESYFMQNLIDGDLAANNGGWQWSASTGTDAAPYFRIFNPIRQSERFDPNGSFIKTYCPELSGLSPKAIHDPYTHMPLLAAQTGYPKPIIHLQENRLKVIAAFKDSAFTS
jgi:deoxyribodipyrimidine photo-lyase